MVGRGMSALPRSPDSAEGAGSGDTQASFIESVLCLLFLQKFDQYDQMQDALRSHLKGSGGRRALARVLCERHPQWGAMTNRGVAERLVTVVALAFNQLASQASMDRVTGKQSFDKEAGTSLNLIEMAQSYVLTEASGTPTCLAAELSDQSAVWGEMRLWHAMLDYALPVDVLSAAGRRSTRGVDGDSPTAAAGDDEMDPEYARESELARTLGNFSYVMLAQLSLPVQAVVAFVASICEERKVGKEAKAAILAVLDELAKDLSAAAGRTRERSDSKLKSPHASEKGLLMTGYMYKQCGHAIGQNTTRPYPVNVCTSRVWKRFWFELKQNELVYYPTSGRDRSSAPIQRIALHEQDLNGIDEESGVFTLRSKWRSNNFRIVTEADLESDGSSPREGRLFRGKQNGGATPRGRRVLLDRVKGDSPISSGTSQIVKWVRALAVAIEQCQARTAHAGPSTLSSSARGLRMTPVPKTEADVSAIATFAENLWMKHDMAKIMEGTNKELAEQIKGDMRDFVAASEEKGETPTLAEWAKVSVWSADTGGMKDASGSAIRAQRGLWKTLFEQVLAQDMDQANLLRALEMVYADNIAGEEPKMVRSLCYDMGHVFEDERDLADAIADMRAIGEGTVTEFAFKKWWFKNAKNIVMPHAFSPATVDAIQSFKDFDRSSCGVLSRAEFLELTRDLNWPDVDAWRAARVLSDEGGNVSLRAFIALFNDHQLTNELVRVYDLDQDGVCSPTEFDTLCLEWFGSNQHGAADLLGKYGADATLGLTAVELLALVQEENDLGKRELPEGVPPSAAVAAAEPESEPQPEPELEPEPEQAALRIEEASPTEAAISERVAAWVALAELKKESSPQSSSFSQRQTGDQAASASSSANLVSPDPDAETPKKASSPVHRGTSARDLVRPLPEVLLLSQFCEHKAVAIRDLST